MEKEINIIGGSGFIGTRLAKRLSSTKCKFSIIDKNVSEMFPELTAVADVRSLDQLRRSISNGATIVNLAAEHRDDVTPASLYHEVNVEGARNICDVAREKNVNAIIFTSTVAVYGFAAPGTDERGQIRPFNEYGKTKYSAELVFREWQAEAPQDRTLVIVRPTVVFGEGNRGNVFNLMDQIYRNRFIMIGSGRNKKSLAYVENLAAFLEHSFRYQSGTYVFNFADKPDFTMLELTDYVRHCLGRTEKIKLKLPFLAGYALGKVFDIFASATGKRLRISSIRVKKFCADSTYETSISSTGFVPPVCIKRGLQNTIQHEFVEHHSDQPVFLTE